MNHIEFWATADLLATSGRQCWTRSWQQDLHLSESALPVSENQIHKVQGNKVFDVASLTKVLCAGSLLVHWAESEKWSLVTLGEQKVYRWIPELKGQAVGQLRIDELWEHRSSLVANCALSDQRKEFFKLNERPALHQKLLSFFEDPSLLGPSKATVYSDVGYVLIALVLERAHRCSLNELWRNFRDILKISDSCLDFAVDNVPFFGALPTETRHPSGEVNDDKAFVMGGVAAHAGLFADMEGLKAWMRAVFEWSQISEQAQQWLFEDRSAYSQRFAWGWDTASGAPDSHAGPSAPKSTRGHLGYTGTALWLDPKTRRAGVLLSNRVYPSHSLNSQKSIQSLRTWCFESFWQGKLYEGWAI